MAYSHSRWYTMGIDDYVRCDTLDCKRKIFLSIGYTHCSFLPMPTCEFITLLWDPLLPHFNLDEFVPSFVPADHDILNNSLLRPFQRCRCIPTNLLMWLICSQGWWNFYDFTNDYVISTYPGPWENQAIQFIQFTISSLSYPPCVHLSW